jgi:hypothetical protein
VPVYVDEVMNHGGSATFRWKDSCHMYADTLDELHAFAKSIGLKRAWFQDKRLPHYDLNVGRHRAALAKGAVQHTRRQAVDFWASKEWHPKRLVQMEFEGEEKGLKVGGVASR